MDKQPPRVELFQDRVTVTTGTGETLTATGDPAALESFAKTYASILGVTLTDNR